jgi:sporulation protein YlmC with PRC-barrel domain
MPLAGVVRKGDQIMRVDLDAKVRTRDGESAGSVQGAIVDPQANQVSDFVISTGGLFGYDVLVPRERLETGSREGDIIRLDLTKQELKNLPRYTPADYTVPATGWVPPVGYAYPTAAFLWPVGYVPTPQTATIRAPGDGEGAAETWPIIEKGTVVRDRTGDEVGVVDDLRIEPHSGRLQGLVVRAGGTIETFFGGGDTVELDISEVERIAEGVVYLRLGSEDINR